MPGPLPRWLTRCIYPFLPLSRRPSPKVQWVGSTTTSAQRLQSGWVFHGCSHSIIFRPPSLLATQVVPTAGTHSDDRAAVAFTSEQNAVRCLPAHRMLLAVRIGQLTAEVFRLLDLQPCWLLRTYPHNKRHRRKGDACPSKLSQIQAHRPSCLCAWQGRDGGVETCDRGLECSRNLDCATMCTALPSLAGPNTCA